MWLAVGLAAGALMLTRENALVFVAAIIVWLMLRRSVALKVRAICAGLFLLGLAVVLLPIAIRNQVVGGEFHLTTSQFGPNFYIGNNAKADGTYQALRYGRGAAKYERRDATELAEKAAGKKLTPGEVSAYWTGQAWEYIKSEPGDWLGLMGRKFFLLCSAVEAIDTEDQHTHADWSLPLRLSGYFCHFGVVLPLALLGAWLTWDQRGKLTLVYLLLAVYAASVLMFYVFGRYRYPLVPFLVLFAGAGLVQVRELLQRRPGWRIALPIGAVVVLAVLSNWPAGGSADAARASTYSNMGVSLRNEGKFEEAAVQYRRAIELNPSNLGAHYNLANTLLALNRLDEAIVEFRLALRLDPSRYEVRTNLANTLVRVGRLDEAATEYELALESKPDAADTVKNLALTLERQGEVDRAAGQWRRLLELKGDHALAHYHVGLILAQRDEVEAAIGHLKQAAEARGDWADPHYALGGIYYRQGRSDLAVDQWRKTVSLSKSAPGPLNSLAWVLATSGDETLGEPAEAISYARQACEITKYKQPALLDTLAAAYAAAGQWEHAIETAGQAIILSQSTGLKKLASQIEERLKLYKKQQPYRKRRAVRSLSKEG